jgi:hypothetical protein
MNAHHSEKFLKKNEKEFAYPDKICENKGTCTE